MAWLILFEKYLQTMKAQPSDSSSEAPQTAPMAKTTMKQTQKQPSSSRPTGRASMENLDRGAFWTAIQPISRAQFWIARVEKEPSVLKMKTFRGA